MRVRPVRRVRLVRGDRIGRRFEKAFGGLLGTYGRIQLLDAETKRQAPAISDVRTGNVGVSPRDG